MVQPLEVVYRAKRTAMHVRIICVCWNISRLTALQPTLRRLAVAGGTSPNPNPAAHGGHPIHVHPARPLYRFAARGLGASMWFFVCLKPQVSRQQLETASDIILAYVQSIPRRRGATRPEAPMGPLSGEQEAKGTRARR